jgi:hypothetical protein
MATAHVNMTVTHSQYWISEIGVFPDVTTDMYRDFNGLINVPAVALSSFAIVMTGTEHGKVSVSVDWRDTEPPLDLEPWDEIVEVSMWFEEEPGVVFGPLATPEEALPQLPPGWYRVRVLARGRDHGYDLMTVAGAPVEEHLIMAWPAPEGPEVRHKLTDSYGASVRAR